MSSYYMRQTGLARANCSWWREHFHLNDEGLLSTINEFEDGFIYLSPPLPFPAPRDAQPSTAADYGQVLARYNAKKAQEKEEADRQKTISDQMKAGRPKKTS